jgi:hypothetical protein
VRLRVGDELPRLEAVRDPPHDVRQEQDGRAIDARLDMSAPDLDSTVDDDIGNDLLHPMFVACLDLIRSSSATPARSPRFIDPPGR